MPLNQAERDFLDHYILETSHFGLGSTSAIRQVRSLDLDHGGMLWLCKARQQEWIAEDNPCYSLDFMATPRVPDRLAPCPWPDDVSFRLRVKEVTLLSEENAHLSRDFDYHERWGFANRAPDPESSPVVYSDGGVEPPKGWAFRARFSGIKRGHVADGFREVPVSIWDPTSQPPSAVVCRYLAIVEAEPGPIRIWGITRSDVLWFTRDGVTYRSIFPTPPAP